MPEHGIHSRAPIIVTGDAINRFWEKVNKDGDCWIWTAATRSSGYGCFKVAGRLISAHRFSFVLHFGEVPVGQVVCHKCDNRLCVRPEHVFAGTPKGNVVDMDAKGRRGFLKGAELPNAKLSDEKVEEVFRLRRAGKSHVEIASLEGVSRRQIEKVLNGRAWRHVSERLRATAS